MEVTSEEDENIDEGEQAMFITEDPNIKAEKLKKK